MSHAPSRRSRVRRSRVRRSRVRRSRVRRSRVVGVARWAHLFDGGAWETRLAKQCAVRSIPATFLIGKDGILLATNLRGETLEAGVSAALAK